jgi:hypothetical protein
MGRRVRWWWNGRWGRLARQDVKIYTDGTLWWLEDVRGGVEGRVRRYGDLDEARALALAEDLMVGSDGWTDMEAASPTS